MQQEGKIFFKLLFSIQIVPLTADCFTTAVNTTVGVGTEHTDDSWNADDSPTLDLVLISTSWSLSSASTADNLASCDVSMVMLSRASIDGAASSVGDAAADDAARSRSETRRSLCHHSCNLKKSQ